MGDRCWLEVWVRREDLENFYAVTDFERPSGECDSPGGFVHHVDEEYNYGFSEIDKFYGAGVWFYGCHSRGDEYPAAEFASDGDDVAYAYGENDEYFVSFDQGTGEPDPESLQSVKRCLLLIDKVRKRANQSDLERLADAPNALPVPEKEVLQCTTSRSS